MMVIQSIIFFIAMSMLSSVGVLTVAQPTHIDQSTYEEGRKQFELMKHQSELPHYGQCWKDAMILTQSGCARLTDGVQGRLSLAYLNCFLDLQGREMYSCSQEMVFEDCIKDMGDVDRNSLTTFFTHTQNICYFLRAQVWNEATERTISVLAESSSNVANQLHESSKLQTEIVKQQNDSLKNQKILIENAVNLSSTLSSSSDEINRMFQTFKETTQEQRLLISNLFDQLTNLKQTVLGEFSGFYSILYYFFSVLVSYLLTSTTRTSGARIWLFSIVTASVFCEYFVTAWSAHVLAWTAVDIGDYDDWTYWIRNCCRKLFAVFGLLVLFVFAYSYTDINAANNQLLVEIRKQNSDLKRLLHGAGAASIKAQSTGLAVGAGDGGSTVGSCTTYSANPSDSNTNSDDTSSESESDKTFILQETESSIMDSDSYMTADTVQHKASGPSLSSREALMAELKDLHCATPLKEMSGQMERWIATGLYSQSPSHRAVPVSAAAATTVSDTKTGSPYMLRPRRGRPSALSPATQVESPGSFARTVKQLERIAEKNSRLVCAAVSSNSDNR